MNLIAIYFCVNFNFVGNDLIKNYLIMVLQIWKTLRGQYFLWNGGARAWRPLRESRDKLSFSYVPMYFSWLTKVETK